MRKILFAFFVLAPFFCLQAQQNLIPNGDFEEWIEAEYFGRSELLHWDSQIGSVEPYTKPVYSGKYSARLWFEAGMTSPNISLKANTQYRCTFYYRQTFQWGTIDDVLYVSLFENNGGLDPERLFYKEIKGPIADMWNKFEFVYTETKDRAVDFRISYFSQADMVIFIDNVVFEEVGVITSLSETEEKNSLQIYPNPASDYIIIPGSEELRSVSIYSMDGRLMSKQDVGTDGKINVSFYPSGVYSVVVSANGFSSTSKFVKK